MKLPFNPAFAALSGLNGRGVHVIKSHSVRHYQTVLFVLGLSQSPEDKDWFVDGIEAARRLKLEMGITAEDGGSNNDDVVDKPIETSDVILESGRAAARAFLRDFEGGLDENESGELSNDAIDSNSNDIMFESSSTNSSEAKEEARERSLNNTDGEGFNFPSRKSHCMTICMVPPPTANEAWEKLSAARKACRDPGFYRWPPHVNMLYPFLEPIFNTEEDTGKSIEGRSKDMHSNFMHEITEQLSRAAEQCSPFNVTIDSFGTFGGKHRGVLWAYPRSSTDANNHMDEEPLIRLQRLLEEQFPICNDVNKAGGAFHPHITLSHYANEVDALSAKKEVESKWEPVSFHVPEIYLLRRLGDDGQFEISATIPLGPDSDVELHNPPIPFPGMPLTEEDWVYDERMKMKKRRRNGVKRRGRGGSSKNNSVT